jgi:hypothetical protein
MELFSGFLIVIEFTIIFIFLIFIFFLNSENNSIKVNLFFNYFFFYFLAFSFFYLNTSYLGLNFNFNLIENIFVLENYFESFNNLNMNDFISIFLNYYNFNSVGFVSICLLLLVGSVICVNLNKMFYFYKNLSFFFKNRINFILNDFFFNRRQNLIQQSNKKQNIRIVKKK